MKKLLQKIGAIFIVIIFLGFTIETDGAIPPDNTLVFLNPDRTIYYPPTRTPGNQGYIPTSYKQAKNIGAKPDKSTGFNIDGPSLIINTLVSYGIISSWPKYWSGTNVAIKQYEQP